MTFKQVGWLALIGLVTGLAAAVAFARMAGALLYGLSAYDPRVLASATICLAIVLFAATYWPARRAAQIAPMEALRHE
jgi:ABC-type antimicrobial peptide transport system permease subunit